MMDKDAATSSIDGVDGRELDGRIIAVNEAKPRAAKKEEDEGNESSGDDLGSSFLDFASYLSSTT
jgi:hypothetical protein